MSKPPLSVMAKGRIRVPKNVPLQVILRYDGLQHMDSLDQLGRCRVTAFNANNLAILDATSTCRTPINLFGPVH